MKKSFTLIEVLVATTIMVTMVTVAATIEINYNNSASVIRHTIQANSLAEESFSLIRLVRDKSLKNDPNTNSLINIPKTKGPWVFNNVEDPTGFTASENGFDKTLNGTKFNIKIYFNPD